MSDQNPVDDGQVQEPFFQDDVFGQQMKFATPEEMKQHFSESLRSMRADYTRKTQSAAEERKQLEEFDKELRTRDKEIQDKAKEFERYDKFVQEHPDVYRDLQQRLTSPADPNVAYERARQYADEHVQTLQEKIDELSNWREQQELDRQKQMIFAQLRSKYPDFDEKSVEEVLTNMAGGVDSLMEMAYYANRGRNPVDAQRRMAETEREKAQARTTSGSGVAPKNERHFNNLDEAAAAARAELGEM